MKRFTALVSGLGDGVAVVAQRWPDTTLHFDAETLEQGHQSPAFRQRLSESVQGDAIQNVLTSGFFGHHDAGVYA